MWTVGVSCHRRTDGVSHRSAIWAAITAASVKIPSDVEREFKGLHGSHHPPVPKFVQALIWVNTEIC